MTQPAHAWSSAPTLVTGASGFLGVALCRLLAAQGAQVHGVSRTRRENSINDAVTKWWPGPLGDLGFVRQLLRDVRPACVFHLAGAVTGVRDLAAVPTTFEANATSTINLLTAAAEHQVSRVVI